MSDDERGAFERSAATLREAAAHLSTPVATRDGHDGVSANSQATLRELSPSAPNLSA